MPQHVQDGEQLQLNVSPPPVIAHPQPEAFHENTPPRSEGTTDMVNGLPAEAETVTGRRTFIWCAALRVRQISVTGSDAPVTSNGQSDATSYVLPTRITTSFVSPRRATNRGSG